MTILSDVIALPSGHIAGIPIEETLAASGPALLVAAGAAGVMLRAGLRRVRHARAKRDLDDPHSAVVGSHDSAIGRPRPRRAGRTE